MKNLVALLPSFCMPLAAQTLMSSHYLTANELVVKMRDAGDTDGDGKRDFVMIARNVTTNTYEVRVVSGATGLVLHLLTGATYQNVYDAVGIGDVDNDGRSDLALVESSMLRLVSGSTGALLWSLPAPANSNWRSVCPAGDQDGNGTADLAVAIESTSNSVRLYRGENGALLTTFGSYAGGLEDGSLRQLGDLTGDGKTEYALCVFHGTTFAVNGVTGATLWSVTPPAGDGGREIDTIDLDGDGKREVLLAQAPQQSSGPPTSGTIHVLDAVTGAVRFSLSNTPGIATALGPGLCSAGDLDQDGVGDFVTNVSTGTGTQLEARSGRDGHRLWSVAAWHPAYSLGKALVALGDLDGDGFGDFACCDGSTAQGRWHRMSGRVRADTQPQAGACGGGPFLPLLGASRPILGQSLTIAGQNGPAGVGGVLVFSLQPTFPTWLGVSSCYAYFDLGAGIALAPLTQAQWSLSVPLPLVPQFAGLEIALQDFYSPTSGPLGYDLSNGVWARLGYQ